MKGVYFMIAYMHTMATVGALSEVLQWQDGLLIARILGLGFIWLMILAGVAACIAAVIALVWFLISVAVELLFMAIDALK
jgi:hypothetical protein